MRKPLQISLCALMLLLLWNATGLAASGPNAADPSSSIHKTDALPTYPAHLPGAYGTPFQGETINNFGRTVPISPEEPQDNSPDHTPGERTLRQTCHYLFSVNTPSAGDRIKKLIFPFHTYL